MRIIWIISLLFCCTAFDSGLSLRAHTSTALFPACEKKEKCGYIDVSGKMVIAPKFTFAGEFSEGLAEVGFKSEDSTKSGLSTGPEELYSNTTLIMSSHSLMDSHGLDSKTYSFTWPFKNGLAKTGRFKYFKALILWSLFRKESLGSEFYINASGKTVWKGVRSTEITSYIN